MSIVEQVPKTLKEQAVSSLKTFEPMIDVVLSYAALTVSEDGIGKVEEAHKAVKRLRIRLDEERKFLNEGALDYQRTVNGIAKTLTAKIEAVENKLKAERDIYDAEKIREKAAKEAEKKARLQVRFNRLAEVGCLSADLTALAAMDDDSFEFHLAAESRKAEEVRIATAEATRIREEREEEERKLRVQEQARFEAEREAIRKEQEQMRAEAARLAAERKIIEDERRVIAEREREAEAARAKIAEESRIEALRPELEKANRFIGKLMDFSIDYLNDIGKPAWSEKAMRRVEMCCREIVADVSAKEM